MTLIGIGVDAVDLGRFRDALRRRPRLALRLFSDAERAYAGRAADPTARLAARFAAKEAVMKAMGVGLGAFALREIEVERDEHGRPGVMLHGGAAALAQRLGVGSWHLSLTHERTVAVAFAIAAA